MPTMASEDSHQKVMDADWYRVTDTLYSNGYQMLSQMSNGDWHLYINANQTTFGDKLLSETPPITAWFANAMSKVMNLRGRR